MREWLTAVAGAAAGLLLCAAGAAAGERLSQGVLDEINFARTQPQAYAEWLQEEAEDSGRRGGERWADNDPHAVAEAIDFLMRQDPLPPLRPHEGLEAAAREHALSQGPSGDVGHTSPGGQRLGQRLAQQGVFAGTAAENISYGQATPRDVVRQLVVDSGVPGRGHRQNIFGRSYQAAGVGCSEHRRYGAMCVIDFGGMFPRR